MLIPGPAFIGPSAPGSPVVRGPYAFAFNTPGIAAGITVYTPVIGDLLLDAWIELTTVFDGTTPKADIGTFVGTTSGLWKATPGTAVPLTLDGPAAGEYGGTGVLMNHASAFDIEPLAAAANLDRFSGMPARFTAANPLKLVVSQDGTAGGTAVGGTAGAARLYIATCSPVPFS